MSCHTDISWISLCDSTLMFCDPWWAVTQILVENLSPWFYSDVLWPMASCHTDISWISLRDSTLDVLWPMVSCHTDISWISLRDSTLMFYDPWWAATQTLVMVSCHTDISWISLRDSTLMFCDPWWAATQTLVESLSVILLWCSVTHGELPHRH